MLKDTTRICEVCSNEYTPKSHNQRACNIDCAIMAKGRYNKYLASLPENKEKRILAKLDDPERFKGYAKGHWEANKERILARRKRRQTPTQKAKIKEYQVARRYTSWPSYFKDLIRYERRKQLTINDILELLEKQNYKCALSGIEMTRVQGSLYNPSIDRIIAGGSYSKDNIQLVCRCLNNWRSNTSIEDFVMLCKKVAEYHALCN